LEVGLKIDTQVEENAPGGGERCYFHSRGNAVVTEVGYFRIVAFVVRKQQQVIARYTHSDAFKGSLGKAFGYGTRYGVIESYLT
jgi:hypothetical protein